MRSQLKKKIDYDSFHDEDESLAGRFKVVAIACGGALLTVALMMILVMFIAIFSGAPGTR